MGGLSEAVCLSPATLLSYFRSFVLSYLWGWNAWRGWVGYLRGETGPAEARGCGWPGCCWPRAWRGMQNVIRSDDQQQGRWGLAWLGLACLGRCRGLCWVRP